MILPSIPAERERVEQPAIHISERDLQAILESNHTIGVATGIIMAEFGISPDEAHAYLVRVSQKSNVKLCDVASILVSDATMAP